ncbi:uncharacterized protein HKW66_Vig0045410 [Vigna angularis]|uniref:Uncharacterized protein n=1 Tax=Phaseolus angularis TaxID=3914 RepID=A0A8T0KZW6_PHAAN|nr:uncharacterized protein HKW66_Vig0045410 [Vigna angularis]
MMVSVIELVKVLVLNAIEFGFGAFTLKMIHGVSNVAPDAIGIVHIVKNNSNSKNVVFNMSYLRIEDNDLDVDFCKTTSKRLLLMFDGEDVMFEEVQSTQ